MWYLNYCTPFLYESEGPIRTTRLLMYITLLLLFISYIVYNIIYKTIGKQVPINPAFSKNQLAEQKKVIFFVGFRNKQYKLNQKKFKEWFTHYFGLHAVATGAAIMYSPFRVQLIFSIVWSVFFIGCSILNNWEKKGFVKVIYNSLMLVCIILDIVLLFTAAMGVGASGYDKTEKICYWER